MDELSKKGIMLLKSLVFHYHGLGAEERDLLERAGKKLDAAHEMIWANGFIAEDHLSAFERSRDFLAKVFLKMKRKERVKQLMEVWEESYTKGYVTEMETRAILTLSEDWQISSEFLEQVKN